MTDTPVCLVSGAARRVGRAIALALANSGHDIAIHCFRSEQAASKLASEIEHLGRRTLVISADLSDTHAPQGVIDQVAQSFGRLDVLVNNASIFEEMSLEALDECRFMTTMQINLVAPLQLCKLSAPLMADTAGGCIINISDIAAQRPWKNYLAYGASKAGLDYATQALAKALAPTIRVNGIAPGIAVFPEDYSDALKTRLVGQVPLQRAGNPEDIAKAVQFLVDSPYITGQILNVDGGRSIA